MASHATVATGFEVNFTAQISGRTTLSRWDFGDGTGVTNRPYTAHGWASPGDHLVVLWAYNESYPNGVNATVTVHVVEQPVHYVAADSSNPVAPYSSWATAATNIQDAVDAASVVGALVLVSDGTYQTGGRVVIGSLTNRLTVTEPLTVRSVNGPGVTTIAGYQVPGAKNGDSAVRCVYLGEEAGLVGFTLTNGATRSSVNDYPDQSGGGVLCAAASAVVSNCVLSGNSAWGGCGGCGGGGGASGGTLNSCTLTGNSALYKGGGAARSTLNDCTLSGNSAERGGGANGGTLNNCTLSGNSAGSGGGAYVGYGIDAATLNNCTLIGNKADGDGGGANLGYGPNSGTLNNCTISSNSAGYLGGGAYGGTLNNCVFTGNSALVGGGFFGGFAPQVGTLNNCTLTGNSASSAGGATGSTLNNCIVYYNVAQKSGANYSGGSFNYSCTTPLPTNSVSNFDTPPLFVDAGSGNLRLQSNSPCINAGLNAFAPAGLDLDGNPRIVGGTVDVGAYEFQTPASLLSYAWLQQYGLPTDGSADYADPDGDGLNNWQEWRAGTDPTDPLSALRLLTPVPGPSGVTVSWQSVGTRTYFLERSTNLIVAPAFLPFSSNIVGQVGSTTLLDTNAAGLGPVFYRVGVQE